MLYFAYGSNLNARVMLRRCPAARPISRCKLHDFRLVFRRVADVEEFEGATVMGGLWRITPACEAALDRAEGLGLRRYRKDYFDCTHENGKVERAMFYVMNSDGIAPPYAHYLETITQGYRDFKIPLRQLHEAVDHSIEKRWMTHEERQRDRRNGRPRVVAEPFKKQTGMPATGNQLVLPNVDWRKS